MNRARIELPETFPFQTELTIRISDINYGGHLGNDKVLTLAHDARISYLHTLGASEMAVGDGIGLIMSDAAIEFRAEAYVGEKISVSVSVMNLTRAGFDIVYKMEVVREGAPRLMAVVRTGMVCFDYARKKVVSIPPAFRAALSPAC